MKKPRPLLRIRLAASALTSLMLACGASAKDSSTAPAASDETVEPEQDARRDCRGAAEDCGARDGCIVVNTLWRLEESGCLRENAVPAGCIPEDTPVQEAVTAAIGPDGACWSFLDSGIPFAFERSEECLRRFFEVPLCSNE
jgi:hypothetical protein